VRKLFVIAMALVCAASVTAGTATAGHGGAKPQKYIVGGGPADYSKWQFTVALLRNGRFACGGTVIAPTKVLTAAHCIERIAPTKMAIIANRPQIDAKGTGELIGVTAAVAHPDYAETHRHDMAVLTLAQATTAPAVTLANPDENNLGTQVGAVLHVAGWGARDPFGVKLAHYIKETTEKVRTTRRCRHVYGKFEFAPISMICTLGSRLSRFKQFPVHSSACSGDSGGPLVADLPSGPRQVGIVSYGGSICGIPGAPTVYSRVSAGLDFIAAQVATP
jgi:trypsin